MNKVNKKIIINHVSYSWFLYSLTALIIIAFWYQAFHLYHKIKLNEKVTIYIAAQDVKNEELETLLEERLLDDKLKDITINFDDYNDSNFYVKLNTIGLIKTDLVILPESVISNLHVLYEFTHLDNEYISNYIELENDDYLELSGIKIAIKIKDENMKRLKDYITYENEKYYLLIRIQLMQVI